MREQTHTMKTVSAVVPGVYSADPTPSVIDRLNFGSVTFNVAVGVGGITFNGTNKVEFKLEASNDNSTWAAVPADEIAGLNLLADDGIVYALKAAHAAATDTRFGYIGDARYLRLTPDFSGTHGTGTGIAVTAILGRPSQAPVA